MVKWTLVAVIVFVAGNDAGAQPPSQREKRLVSRAAFAALNGPALADSSGIRSLDASDQLDALMLETWRWLDSVGRQSLQMPPTQIRKWTDFGSQAHPSEGILIDRSEVDTVMSLVRTQKGMGQVPAAEIARRTPWALRMLVAHEYGHLLQYRHLARDSVENPNLTRVVECAADILGGYYFEEYIEARIPTDSVRKVAREVARDFGYVIGSRDWLDGTSHPLGENRRSCIQKGIETARDSTISTDVVGWAHEQARGAAAEGAVVYRNADLEVVRDTSLRSALRRLVASAGEGVAALRRSRSEQVSPDGSSFLLRDALPTPWRCTIGPWRESEEARCDFETRDASMNATVAELLTQVRSALDTTAIRWAEAPPVGSMGRRTVTFRPIGAGADDARAPQVEVRWAAEGSPVAQLAPRYVIAISVRARR